MTWILAVRRLLETIPVVTPCSFRSITGNGDCDISRAFIVLEPVSRGQGRMRDELQGGQVHLHTSCLPEILELSAASYDYCGLDDFRFLHRFIGLYEILSLIFDCSQEKLIDHHMHSLEHFAPLAIDGLGLAIHRRSLPTC